MALDGKRRNKPKSTKKQNPKQPKGGSKVGK
jgi:hypothetical protein